MVMPWANPLVTVMPWANLTAKATHRANPKAKAKQSAWTRTFPKEQFRRPPDSARWSSRCG
jgi:hypothetical protein